MHHSATLSTKYVSAFCVAPHNTLAKVADRNTFIALVRSYESRIATRTLEVGHADFFHSRAVDFSAISVLSARFGRVAIQLRRIL